VHAVDVEGKQAGIEEDLVVLLGAHCPVPVTYRSEQPSRLGQGETSGRGARRCDGGIRTGHIRRGAGLLGCRGSLSALVLTTRVEVEVEVEVEVASWEVESASVSFC